MATRKKSNKARAQAIVDALTADESPLRSQGVDAFVNALLDMPVGVFVDIDAVVEVVAAASTDANTERMIERHLRPGWDRYVARCEETGETVGDAVPPDVRERAIRLLTTTPPPRGEWAKHAVDPKLVRQLLAPVLQDTLVGFARRLPLPGVAGDLGAAARSSGFGLRNKLKQSVEKRAERFVEAGKSVLGGLGAEVERQIQSVAREFSESAQSEISDSLKRRLKSSEGRKLLTDIATQAVNHVMATPLSELNADTNALPWDDIWPLVPPIAEHNRGRETILAAIREELQATLDVEGARTGRELLEESGLLDLTLTHAVEACDQPAQSLFSSDGFGKWVEALLAVE